jgi:hypothetical protein
MDSRAMDYKHRTRFRFRLVCVLLVLVFTPIEMEAQVSRWMAWSPPYTPVSRGVPTKPADCAAFETEVSQYFSKIEADHSECLRENKADRAQDKPEKCSRSTCQVMHDYLYGSLGLGDRRKDYQNEISKCYEYVKQRQAEEEQRQVSEEKGKKEADEEQRRIEADRDRRRTADEQKRVSDGKKQEIVRKQRQTPSERSKQQAEEKQTQTETDSQRQQPPEEQKQIEADSQRQRQVDEKQKVQEAIAALKDPFEKAENERRAMHLKKPEDALVDPFSNSHRPNPEMQKRQEDQELPEMALRAFDLSIKGIEQNIDTSVELARSQFSKSQLGRKAFANFKEGAQDTKSVASGIGHVARGLEYFAVGKDLYEAHAAGDVERTKYEEEKLAWEVGKDTAWEWSKNAAKQGVGKVIVQLFPKTAPYITRGVSAAAGGLSTFFYSSEIVTEHDQVIFDTSGKFSLEDKQRALFQRWRLYDRNPSAWYPDDLKVLINETDAVYKDAVRENSAESGRVQ